ncbi:inositol monophosphatase family protein [Klebsiella spallanzanii]|uniref:Histidinol-phosphatase n=1 Tax=Klebsiella spallanzanii TaxID=2587528 RepID=A0A564HDU3_9ENTR|nr:inositol monophosphatase family protein [Klebsiella spallanzanii]VUS30764.1 Histidinol-phosphatase [Klebsiella spallanzanii]
MLAIPDVSFLNQLAALSEDLILKEHAAAVNLQGGRDVTNNERHYGCSGNVLGILKDYISTAYPEHTAYDRSRDASEDEFVWSVDVFNTERLSDRGIPARGASVGLSLRGKSVAGMVVSPFTRERFWAEGGEAWASGPLGEFRLNTRRNIQLHQSIMHVSDDDCFDDATRKGIQSLSSRVLMSRWGDPCHAMTMLAAGYIDLCVIHPDKMSAFSPLLLLVKNAGGCVTELPGPYSGYLASSGPVLHAEVLRLLNLSK